MEECRWWVLSAAQATCESPNTLHTPTTTTHLLQPEPNELKHAREPARHSMAQHNTAHRKNLTLQLYKKLDTTGLSNSGIQPTHPTPPHSCTVLCHNLTTQQTNTHWLNTIAFAAGSLLLIASSSSRSASILVLLWKRDLQGGM